MLHERSESSEALAHSAPGLFLVCIKRSKERMIEGVRVLQISREVDWSDGTTTFTIESRLIGPSRSYSLASDSPNREWTTDNFEGFLRSLVQIASIEQPQGVPRRLTSTTKNLGS